jgi:hypothetical protein
MNQRYSMKRLSDFIYLHQLMDFHVTSYERHATRDASIYVGWVLNYSKFQVETVLAPFTTSDGT